MIGKTIPTLLCLLLVTAGAASAQAEEYLVTRVEGAPPIMAPVPHLPTSYLGVDDVLGPGTDFLMLKSTTIVLENLEDGRRFTIIGPNRVRISEDGLTATIPAGVTITKGGVR